MSYRTRFAKINVKLLIILIVITVGLGVSLVAARQIRRRILSKRDLAAGTVAFEKQDWSAAYESFVEYLGRNPEDIEIWKKCAEARLAMRPLEGNAIAWVIGAYRRVMQLAPTDEVACTKLAMLYRAVDDFDDLAYIAERRLEQTPKDVEARLWLTDALIGQGKTQEARTKLEAFVDEIEQEVKESAAADQPVAYPIEYMRACISLSEIARRSDSGDALSETLSWLNRAEANCPGQAEPLVHRARLYRLTLDFPGLSIEERMRTARLDLEAADGLEPQDPRLRLALAYEWINHGELDKAEAELQAAESLPREVIEERFFDFNDWVVARFPIASELGMRRGAVRETADLAHSVLQTLEEKRHRVQVLSAAVRIYVAAGRVEPARRSYDEYEEILYARQKAAEAAFELAHLRALVAKAEGDSYAVIEALQPVVAVDTSNPDLWRLLAEAFSRTDQTRRAVSALVSYLYDRPRDPAMTLRLAKEYLKLRDWNRAFETARLGQSLDPADIVLRLLRIEASIYIAAEQQQKLDTTKLQGLSKELADLRAENPDRVDIRILQAIIAVYQEQPEKAEQELKLAIRECEEPLRAEMQLVRHYYRTKRLSEAIVECRAACERHPEIAEPWLSLAGLHVANNESDSAIQCLVDANEVVVGKWEERSVLMRRAVMEHLYGDRATGIRLLERLAETDKREIRARTLLLSFLEIQKNLAGSAEAGDPNAMDRKIATLIAELREAEGESGLQWRLHQASTWLSSTDWRSRQQSINEMLEYCISADPQWSAPPLLLASMYEKLDDPRRVEAVCRRALARNRSATDIADKLITLLEEQGRLADAEEVLQEVEADAQVKSHWSVQGALQAGDFSRAIEELQLRVANDDRDAKSRILLARLLYWQDKGNVAQALAYLDAAEAITSNSLTITGTRASILRAENRQEEAQRLLDDYVASQDDFDAFMMRAGYLTREGKLDSAEADYKRLAADADPDRAASGYLLLGNFYVMTGRLDEAIATIEEGVQKIQDGRIKPRRDPEGLRVKRGLMKVRLMRGRPQDHEKAMALLAELEARMPDDPELLQLRALRLLNPRTPEEATAEAVTTAKAKLERVVKSEPTAVDAHLALITIAIQRGEYEAARNYAIRAVGSNPNHPKLLFARARAEAALGNVRMAAELSRLLLADDPNSVQAMELLVAAGLQANDSSLLDEALAAGRVIRPSDPNHTAALTMIVGKALQSRDKTLLNKALEWLESERRSKPTDESLLVTRAQVLLVLGRAQEAIPECEAYCGTPEGSDRVRAHLTLANLYRATGDMDRAGQRIEQAERIDPNDLAVIHARVLWLVVQNRSDELEKISEKYLSAKDPNPATLVAAGSILAAMETPTLKGEAMKLFEHALTLSPALLSARLGLATTAYQMGNAERAKELYRGLIEQYPSNVRILNDLAWILQEHEHDYEAALELANRGLSRVPDDPHLLDTRGTILANMPGRLADARRDFSKLAELAGDGTPAKAKALLQLGRICMKLDEADQAKQHLETAMQIDGKIGVFTPEERSEIADIL